MRILPKSLLGQVMLALTAALLVAQAISATLLYRAGEQRRETAILNVAAFQLLVGERRSLGREERRERFRADDSDRRAFDDPRNTPFRLPRRLRYEESQTPPFSASVERDETREESLKQTLRLQGILIDELVVVSRPILEDPAIRNARRFEELRERMRGRRNRN